MPTTPQPRNDLTAGAELERAQSLQQLGRIVAAEAAYRRVLAREPNNASALHLLGLLARDCGHMDAAAGLLRRAVEASPQDADFRSNLGALLCEMGRLREAEAELREALRLQPHHPDANLNLGVVLERMGRPAEAEAAFRKAAELKPDDVEAHFQLGELLRKTGRLAEAEEVLRRGLRVVGECPAAATLYRGLGSVHADRGQLDEAVACRRKVVQLAPGWSAGGSDLLFTLYYHPAYGPPEHYEEAVAWARRHARGTGFQPVAEGKDHGLKARATEASATQAGATPATPGRLRVGYISPDLRDHPIARLVEPVLAGHDRSAFEVFCYSDALRPDAVTRHLRGLAEHWRDIAGMPDAAAADLVRRDGIDILVETAGHFGDHRLTLMARKPAPVQVSGFGYCGTTGLEAIDYRLTDAASDPPGETEAYHVEKLWRLPEVCWCYRPFEPAPQVQPLPASSAGHVTFGCLNNQVKVTDRVVEVWSRVLRAVPGARLLLLGVPGDPHVVGRFVRHDIEPSRIEIAGRRPRFQYLELHNRIDVCLDPFPFNGDNTLCDAMWMGVPTVSLAGRGFHARRGVSHLSAVGMSDWVADTEQRYVETAARRAWDLPGLSDLRRRLRQRLAQSPLGDAAGYTRSLEAAYRAMWDARRSIRDL